MLPLSAMSFAAFVYVTYEMFAVGLIRPMAQDLEVTEGQIGLLMSVYAGLVAVVTIPLMHFTRNWDRRPVFLATLGFLAGGVILQGIANSYAVLVAARVTAAFTHGLFWSLINPMAARLAPKGMTGKAVATVSFGSTMSAVIGTPLTTMLGGMIGWRGATWVLGVAVIFSVVALVASLPSMPAKHPEPAAGAKRTKSAIPSLVLFLTFNVTAVFTTFTYLALLMTTTAGPKLVPFGLSLFGICGVIGVLTAGNTVDRRMIRVNGFVAVLLVGSAALGLLALETKSVLLIIAMIIVFGLANGALPPSATTIFLHAGKRNEDLASSIYVVTYQVGIAAGSALGAAVVDAGFLPGTLCMTAGLAACAFITLVVASRPRLR